MEKGARRPKEAKGLRVQAQGLDKYSHISKVGLKEIKVVQLTRAASK